MNWIITFQNFWYEKVLVILLKNILPKNNQKYYILICIIPNKVTEKTRKYWRTFDRISRWILQSHVTLIETVLKTLNFKNLRSLMMSLEFCTRVLKSFKNFNTKDFSADDFS